MNRKMLEKILKDERELNKVVENFKARKLLFVVGVDNFGVEGHIAKSKHNLRFVNDNFKLGYFDWVVTGCYYSVYHSVLALILSKGFSSKNHDASLAILIQEFYKDFVSDFDFINALFIDYSDVNFYIETKEKRKLASYSSSSVFSKVEVKSMISRATEFVNKAEEILDEE